MTRYNKRPVSEEKDIVRAEVDDSKDIVDMAVVEEDKKEVKSNEYEVSVVIDNLNIRTGPGKEYERVRFAMPGRHTIVDEKNGYGKLKDGSGWILLKFATKI